MDKSLKISKHDVTPYTFHLHSQFAQLLSLIRRGHYDDSIDLLRREPKILKLRDRMGRSALHHCADCWPMSPNRPNVNADIGQILIRMMPNIVEWQDQEGNIALHLAVINGDLPFVRKLLRSMTSAQINIADYELHTVIHWAVVSGQLDAMTMAIEHGADPSTPDIYGAYPLHYATQNFFDMATTGNSVQSSIKIGSTRHLSSQQLQQMQLFGSSTNNLHQLEPIPLLLPDINSKSSSISHLQHQKQQPQQSTAQARAESLRILHYLLTRPQIDVNCIDNEQRTPLIWAASSGNHDALLVLVKSGAEISQQDKDGLSALHCASSRGHYRCVHTLITMCGADVHQLDSGGCTPLFYAVALGHPDCVRLLMESGARLDHQDNKGRTAAHCGASKGQFETLKLLHENGANLWLKNVRGDLPLHDAVKSGRVDLVKWFLDQSPESVNDANHYGRTPLHIAAFNHNLEMCKLLISYGANVNAIMKIRNQYLTPLEAALQNGNDIRSVNLDELLEYLRRNGAQSLSQIDRHLVDHNIDKLNETDIDTNAKFLLSPLSDKNMPTSINDPLPQKDSSIALDPSLSKIRSRRSHETNRAEDQRRTGTKTKSARFADSETTKLPNLVQNGHDNKSRNIPNSDSSSSTSTSTSSPPNSIIHSASSHHHKHHFSEHLKNVREYETILDDDKNKDNCHLKHHPTHLKQAIITNVYLTTAAPIATTNGAIPLTPIENKDGEITSTASIATGTALVPVYYVKRVPQLKKISTSQKRTKKLKKTRIIGDGQVSVKLETRDTFQSTSGDLQQKQQHHEEHLFIQNEIISDKSAIDSRENDGENKDEDAGDEDENEDAEEEEGEDKLNQEDEENSEIMMTVLATKEHEEEVNEENEKETIEDKTPDSGAANQITESQEVIEDKKDDGDDVMTRESLSASSFESTAMDTVRKDSKIISDDDNSKDTRPEIPHELIQRDFVQSINHDDDHDHENIDEDKDDDGRRKRSIANIINEPKLTAQKSVESLRSPKLSAANSVEEAEEEASTSMKDDAKEDANQDLADEQRPLLIIKMTQKVEKDEDSEPRIVDVTNEQDANNAKTIDDNVSKNESTDHQTETDDHSEVHEMEIRKKEIIYNVIDDNVASKTDEIATQSADTMTINEDENENEKKSMESIVEQKSLEIREDPNKMEIESSSAPSLHSSDVDDNLDDQSQQQQGEESHLKPSDDDQSSVIRRGSFTKGSIGEMSVVDRRTIKQSISSDKIVDNTDVVSDNKQDYPAASPVIESSFGPVKQLKGKKKSYDYVRPKVDTYWSDDYYQHHQQQHHMNRRDHSPGQLMVASKYHDRCKHPYHHHHYCHHDKYGSMGYLATSSHDDYARIDPKIINQTVEKYLRKYYLERQLFEELYDLKRYQIRTGRTNEPQSVRRLVDRFRREMKAPGMVDFKGPYTYRAYEMYLYDLLRQLSRSNHKKIAYLTKSISYDDLASSFERLQAELNESAAAAQTCDHVHHHRPKRQHGEYYAKIAGVNASDISSETSDFPNDQHRREYNEKRKRESATTRHRSHSRYDPLQDYDRHPHGLVVDYKYEYHKSQHRRGDDKRGELVDVICENLFKSTGLHGSKMDEMAVTRKIVQLSGQEDNGNNNNNDDVDINNASDKPEKSSMNDMKGDDGNSDHVATTEQKVRWPKHCDCKNNSYNKRECNYTNNNYMNDYDDDDDGYNLSRCSIYGHQGLSPLNIIESNSNSPVNLNRRLKRLANNNSSNSNKTISNVKNRKPKRKIYFLSNEPYKVNIPCENAIHQRWQQIKQQERKRKLNSNFRFNNRRSSYTSSSIDSDVTLWFELNQKWRS